MKFRYDPNKNPRNAYIPGVPLRDLSAEEFDALPPGVQTSVTRCDWYVLPTKTRRAKSARPSTGDAPQDGD